MKKFIFLLPFLFLLASFTHAQINCGTVLSPQYLLALQNETSNKFGCLDSFDLYDLNAPITFNLVLSYAKFGNGAKEFNQDSLDAVEADINDVYNDQNIYFNIMWNNLDCDVCLDHFDNWPDYLETSTCIQGHIVHEDIPNGSSFNGVGAISKGRFWAKTGSTPPRTGSCYRPLAYS